VRVRAEELFKSAIGAGHQVSRPAPPSGRGTLRAAMLPLVPPILPQLVTDVPRGREWVYELKMDGFRGMLYLDQAEAFFRSKTTKKMPRFRALAAAVALELQVDDAILDGEIVAMGSEGPDFYALMRNSAAPHFAAFDVVWLNGKDLRGEPYSKRKTTLKRLLRKKREHISLVDFDPRPDLYAAVAGMDLEGIVAKRTTDVYGPETRWLKVRNPDYSQKVGRAELFHGPRR
jgi:bifunctional non-homologous end joining protein LigD